MLRGVFSVVVLADLGMGHELRRRLLPWEILSALGIGTRDEVSNRNYISTDRNRWGGKTARDQTSGANPKPTACKQILHVEHDCAINISKIHNLQSKDEQ